MGVRRTLLLPAPHRRQQKRGGGPAGLTGHSTRVREQWPQGETEAGVAEAISAAFQDPSSRRDEDESYTVPVRRARPPPACPADGQARKVRRRGGAALRRRSPEPLRQVLHSSALPAPGSRITRLPIPPAAPASFPGPRRTRSFLESGYRLSFLFLSFFLFLS